jgi:hypothetical protein
MTPTTRRLASATSLSILADESTSEENASQFLVTASPHGWKSGRRRADFVVVRLVCECDFRFMIDGLLTTDQEVIRALLHN